MTKNGKNDKSCHMNEAEYIEANWGWAVEKIAAQLIKALIASGPPSPKRRPRDYVVSNALRLLKAEFKEGTE